MFAGGTSIGDWLSGPRAPRDWWAPRAEQVTHVSGVIAGREMADNENSKETNAATFPGVRKVSVQVLQGSSNKLSPVQSPVARRKSSLVNMDAWSQAASIGRRGSINRASWTAETSDSGREKSNTSTSPVAPRGVSRENSREPSRNPSSENQPSNTKPNDAGGPRRKSLGWPGISSPTKSGDASVPDNSMAQFKVLMCCTPSLPPLLMHDDSRCLFALALQNP